MLKKDQITIPDDEIESRTWGFFNSAINFLDSASKLMQYPALWEVSLILSHYFFERFLKGVGIYQHKTLVKTHNLQFLVSEISFIKLDDFEINILKKIDAYFDLRFPGGEGRLQNVLDDIGEEIAPGLPRKARQFGTEDFIEVVNLAEKIIDLLPSDLIAIFEDAETSNDRDFNINDAISRMSKK